MNNVIPLQNSPERVSLLPIAPGVDFATALSLRRMATSTGATPAYLLAPEVSALLFYMPDQRHHMLFATLWNTGMRIGEARMLTPESFDLDGVRQTYEFDDFDARVMCHEYDHLEGILYTDKATNVREAIEETDEEDVSSDEKKQDGSN